MAFGFGIHVAPVWVQVQPGWADPEQIVDQQAKGGQTIVR